ncbi:MAG TPA: EthD domain-containing protein [Duganella sp.]|nr:EthD domain-containing protein [Duganella sp.]
MIKLMIVGRRRGGMTLRQAHTYMRDVHGASVVRFIGELPHLAPRRYIQNHVFDGCFRVPDGGADTFAGARDFVTQVWFDDAAQAAAALSAPFYLDVLQPDEDRFVDQSSVVRLPVVERETHGGGDGAAKVFVMLRAAPGVTYDDLAAASAPLWRRLLEEEGLGIARVVRNQVLVRPGTPAPTVDLVDEIWLSGDDAARGLGERWLTLASDRQLASLLSPGSTVVLMARQHVLYAGAST